MKTSIQIEGLTKVYNRVGNDGGYLTLRDKLSNLFSKKTRSKPFTALDNLDLLIAEGERMGIVGRNGAGKSTLLKIISQITPPSKGHVTLDGRVASLLEVGTGFHPELTGRENIYLNGSILGLKRAEINRRMNEIIEFSGVADFINSPLKNYSTGMQLRLAFSVAAHLEPEILLIDEVLAVGDVEFQQKCIGKMEEISRQQGRTIVFVSHNMAAVKKLCTSATVLSDGKKLYSGSVQEAIDVYTNNYLLHTVKTGYANFDLRKHPNKIAGDEGILEAAMFVNDQPSEVFAPGSSLTIRIKYQLKKPLIDPDVGIVIKDADQHPLLGLNNKHLGKKISLQNGTEATVSIRMPELNLFRPGKYRVNLYFGDNYHFYECLYDAFEFTVIESDVYHSGHAMEAEWNQIYVPKIDIG